MIRLKSDSPYFEIHINQDNVEDCLRLESKNPTLVDSYIEVFTDKEIFIDHTDLLQIAPKLSDSISSSNYAIPIVESLTLSNLFLSTNKLIHGITCFDAMIRKASLYGIKIRTPSTHFITLRGLISGDISTIEAFSYDNTLPTIKLLSARLFGGNAKKNCEILSFKDEPYEEIWFEDLRSIEVYDTRGVKTPGVISLLDFDIGKFHKFVLENEIDVLKMDPIKDLKPFCKIDI